MPTSSIVALLDRDNCELLSSVCFPREGVRRVLILAVPPTISWVPNCRRGPAPSPLCNVVDRSKAVETQPRARPQSLWRS